MNDNVGISSEATQLIVDQLLKQTESTDRSMKTDEVKAARNMLDRISRAPMIEDELNIEEAKTKLWDFIIICSNMMHPIRDKNKWIEIQKEEAGTTNIVRNLERFGGLVSRKLVLDKEREENVSVVVATDNIGRCFIFMFFLSLTISFWYIQSCKSPSTR